MKFTRYFESMRQRPDRAAIRLQWVRYVVEHPMRGRAAGRRIRRWAAIAEMDGRYLRRYTAAGRRDRSQRFL